MLLFIRVLVFVFLLPSLLMAHPMIVKSDKYRVLSQDHEAMVVIEIKGDKEFEKSAYQLFVSGNNALAIQKHPERSANRKLLMRDDELWLYTPGVKKPIRVGIDQRLNGDVANGDILRTQFASDYTAEIKSETDKQVTFKLSRKSKSAAYALIDYTLEAKSAKPLKAEFFAASGKLMKTAEYKNLKKTLGEDIISEVQITDSQTKRVSIIKYGKYKLKKYSPQWFNKESVLEL